MHRIGGLEGALLGGYVLGIALECREVDAAPGLTRLDREDFFLSTNSSIPLAPSSARATVHR